MKIKGTKSQYVFENLKAKINNGEISPGDKLPISTIAKEYNVSEIPVREALQQLESEGIVELTPHTQAKVISLTEKDISEIFQLRIELESLATSLAIDNLSNADIMEIEGVFEESIAYAEKNEFKEYFKFNRLFHETIYKYCDNRRLQNMISNLYENSSRHPRIFTNKDYVDKSIQEHSYILAAIKKRDKALVEKLVREHKERARDAVLKKMKERVKN